MSRNGTLEDFTLKKTSKLASSSSAFFPVSNKTLKSVTRSKFDYETEKPEEREDFSKYFLGSSIDLPEEDFPLAKNLHEFVFSKKFANLGDTGLFPRQLGIGLNFFSEYCPDCSDLAFVKKNFNVASSYEEILDRTVLLEHGVCPRCSKNKLDFISEGKLSDNWELAGLVGQRGGKSYSSGVYQAYTLHKFLKFKNIQEHFKIAKPTILVGTFVALDKSQIQDSTWGFFRNIIDSSPWFTGYLDMLKDSGRRLGRELVDRNKVESLEFFHKNIKLNMASPKPGALRGRTGIMGTIDEIGWLKGRDDGGRVVTAEEVYNALANRMGTLVTSFQANRFNHVNLPCPTFISISSPSHARDMICTLTKGIQQQEQENFGGSSLKRYWFHYPTWEMNPNYKRDDPYIVSKYKDNAKDAERDFGANPPLSSNAFINDSNILPPCFVLESNILSLDYSLQDKTHPYTVSVRQNPGVAVTSYPRILTLDLGYNNNSTALTIGYYNKELGKTIIDGVLEIIPSIGCEVNFFTLVERVLKPLISALNIKMICTDRWQSLGILQQLAQTAGVATVTYSLNYNDFQLFKQSLSNQKILFPKIEDAALSTTGNLTDYPFCFYQNPLSHLFFQCLTVVDETDKTIKKGEKTTDDIFRSAVLLHYILNNPHHLKTLDQESKLLVNKIGLTHVETANGPRQGGEGAVKYSGKIVVVR